MKLKLAIVLSITALAVFLMTASNNQSSTNLRRLQQANISNSSLPASFKLNGIGNLIQALNAASNFSNSSFDVLTIDTLSQSVTDQGILYQAIATLTNDQGDSVDGLLNGLYDPVSNSVVFNASQYSPPSENSNSSNSSAPAGPNVTSDGYTILDVNQAQNDSDAVAAFNWGEQTILNNAQQNRKIPPSTYNVSQWLSAAYKNWTNGITYQFAALAQGENGVNVQTKFNVTYNNKSNSYRLKDLYYHASNITLEQLAALNATNTTTNATNVTVAVNSTTNGTAPDNATITVADNSTTFVGLGDNSTNSSSDNNATLVVDNSTVINASNPAIISDNSTAVNASSVSNASNASNSSAPVVNATNNTIVIPVGYTALDNTTIAQNQQAYNALLFGSQAVVSKAINQYKLPSGSPNYTITGVDSAIYKNQSNGVWYVFAANLQNALNYKVNANFTVFYRNANQSYSLNGYGYYSSNYKPNAIIKPAGNSNVISNVSAIISNATVPNANSTLLSIAPVNSTLADLNSTIAALNSTIADVNSTIADTSSVIANASAGSR